jgi:hypothetical protein
MYIQVINGMSKRTDSEEFMRDFPIGIVPGSIGTNEKYSVADSAVPFFEMVLVLPDK